jgi:hypothetical protein
MVPVGLDNLLDTLRIDTRDVVPDPGKDGGVISELPIAGTDVYAHIMA